MQGFATSDSQTLILHATTVDFAGQGILITGASGAGKSALGLQLMALGASLVSDDRTCVSLSDGHLVARAPDAIVGMIEARGVGLLKAKALPESPLVLAVDLDQVEVERLPQDHIYQRGFVRLPCLHKIDAPYFPAAIVQFLKAGKQETG